MTITVTELTNKTDLSKAAVMGFLRSLVKLGMARRGIEISMKSVETSGKKKVRREYVYVLDLEAAASLGLATDGIYQVIMQ